MPKRKILEGDADDATKKKRKMPDPTHLAIKVPINCARRGTVGEQDMEFTDAFHDAIQRHHQIMVYLSQLVNIHMLGVLPKWESLPAEQKEWNAEKEKEQPLTPSIGKISFPTLDHNWLCQFLSSVSCLGQKEKEHFKIEPEIVDTIEHHWNGPTGLLTAAGFKKQKLPSRSLIIVALKNYAIKRYETAIRNNISVHFEKRHFRYLQMVYAPRDPNGQRKELKRTERNELLKKCREYQKLIFAADDPDINFESKSKEEQEVWQWILEERSRMPKRPKVKVPEKKAEKSSEKKDKSAPKKELWVTQSICAHIGGLKTFSKYLPYMFHMLKETEKRGEKTFALLPQVSSFVPGHITISTLTLRRLFISLNENSVAISDADLWARFFNYKQFETRNKKFKFLIDTDGYSVSFQMTKPALGKKKTGPKDKFNKKVKKNDETTRAADEVEQDPITGTPKKGLYDLKDYLKDPDRQTFLKGAEAENRLVGADPGYHNLWMMARPHSEAKRGEMSEFERMRYSAGMRKEKSNRTKYTRKQERMLQSHPQVNAAQTILSEATKKTASLQKYLVYVKLRFEVAPLLTRFYGEPYYRKFKRDVYLKTQSHETQLLNSISEKFGENCVIMMGDWSKDSTNHFQGLAPMPQIGLRRKLASRFLVLNTDEAYSSQICPKCDERVAACHETELELKNEKGKIIRKPGREIRGLRKCIHTTCGAFWNRDFMGAMNIYRNGLSLIKNPGNGGLLRPVAINFEKAKPSFPLNRGQDHT